MDYRIANAAVVAATLMVGSCATVSTPKAGVSPDVRVLQQSELSNVVATVKQEVVSPSTYREYIVEGDRRFDGWALSADRLVFKPGSRLVFTREALNSRPSIFIFAREIRSESQESPGKVSWERPSLMPPQDAGAASAGEDNGARVDVPGGAGGAGRQGNNGEAGLRAPDLTIVADAIKSPLIVDLSGQDGGPGGKGQNGGRGGGGGRGHDASQSMLGCIHGANSGASGGNGGTGGKGGTSGSGGRGGIFTLIASSDNLGAASRLIKVDVSGGRPGAVGGPGGDGGAGGPGGPGGAQQLPFCQGNGHQGLPGSYGQNGPSGDIGEMGMNGDYFVGGLSSESIGGLLQKR